jgi:hypothetical protein
MKWKVLAVVAFIGLLGSAGCGSDDDESKEGDEVTCTCECACCVALGSCNTPRMLEVEDVAECDHDCSTECDGSFANTYSCS